MAWRLPNIDLINVGFSWETKNLRAWGTANFMMSKKRWRFVAGLLEVGRVFEDFWPKKKGGSRQNKKNGGGISGLDPLTISMLPYKMLPKLMVIELMHFCIMWLNAFLVKSGISEKYSPWEFVSRHKLDVKLHCKMPFGAYCKVHIDPEITITTEPMQF